MLNVDFLGSIGEEGSAKAIAVESAARESNTCTLELLVVGIPCLDESTFRLNTVIRFEVIEPLELALVLLFLLSPSQAPTQKQKRKYHKKLSHDYVYMVTKERMFVL